MTIPLLLLALAACRVDGPVSPDTVVSISPGQATLSLGASLELGVTVRDPDGQLMEDVQVTWWTPDSGIATVSPDGVVTGVGVGTVEIAAITEDRQNSGFASIQVVGEGGNVGCGECGSGAAGPTGLTLLADRAFASQVEAGWTWPNKDQQLSLLSDNSSPKSSPSIIRMTYPAGFQGGSAPFGPIRRDMPAGTHEIHVSLWVRYSSNWQGHPSGVNKVFYINPAVGKNFAVVTAYGIGSGQMRWQVTPELVPQNNLGPNQSGLKLQRGQWHHLEVYVAMNSAGNADGKLYVWQDGTLTHRYDNVVYAQASDPHDIDHIRFSSVWGGGGSTVNNTMWYELDHATVSTR